MTSGELIILGSAGSAPGPYAPCSGYLVRDEGCNLLLDLGPGSAVTMQRHVEAADVDAVILSHGHSDGSDDGGPMPGHLTAGDAGRLAARAGVRLLVLTHMRPWDDHGMLLADAAAVAPCPVVAAVPDLRIALP